MPEREPKYSPPIGTPERNPNAGDEPDVASAIRLMGERLGLEDLRIQKAGRLTVLGYVLELGTGNKYRSSADNHLDALLDLHEQLRAELISRIALDHDVLTRVRGTHAIRRRRDRAWYGRDRDWHAQRSR